MALTQTQRDTLLSPMTNSQVAWILGRTEGWVAEKRTALIVELGLGPQKAPEPDPDPEPPPAAAAPAPRQAPRADARTRPRALTPPEGLPARDLARWWVDNTAMDFAWIARQCGMSADEVSAIADEAPPPTKPPSGQTHRFDHDEAARLYRGDGLSPFAIARRLGVSDNAVRKALGRMGIVVEDRRPNCGGPKPDPGKDAAMATAYLVERLTLQEVATRFDTTKTTVARALERTGTPRRPAGGSEQRAQPTHLDPEIVRLYTEESMPTREIGGKLGITNWQVRQALGRAGVEMRSQASRVAKVVDEAELCRQYAAGATVHALQRQYGICTTRVGDILRAHGVPVRAPGKVAKPKPPKLVVPRAIAKVPPAIAKAAQPVKPKPAPPRPAPTYTATHELRHTEPKRLPLPETSAVTSYAPPPRLGGYASATPPPLKQTMRGVAKWGGGAKRTAPAMLAPPPKPLKPDVRRWIGYFLEAEWTPREIAYLFELNPSQVTALR